MLRLRIYIWVCFALIMNSLWAQTPAVLIKGKADSRECEEWVEARLKEMTLKEKIGQLFIHTVAPQVTEQNRRNIRDAVKEYKIGGLLFSGGAIENQVTLTNMAQEMASIPLLITFDGEWGLAMRLKGRSLIRKTVSWAAFRTTSYSMSMVRKWPDNVGR